MKTWLRSIFHGAVKRAAKIAGYNAVTWAALGGMSLSWATSGQQVSADAALKVAAYKRGVQLIADYIGKTPFHVKSGHQRAQNHPAWHLVRTWARWHQLSSFEFRRVLTIHALMRGNGYGWIERDSLMKPIKLHVLDPSRITPKVMNGRTVYVVDNGSSYFECHEIIHIRGLSVDGFAGMDPIKTYGVEVLGLTLAQQQYATTYFASGGSPSSYVSYPGVLDDEQWLKLDSKLGPLKRAVDDPHKIPILENGMKLESLNLDAQQTQLLEAREFSLKDIANLLGLPVHKLQGSGNSSYKSLEEENRAFRDDTLDPWLCQFELEYQKLLTEDQQLTQSHDVEAVRESLTRTNMKDRAEILNKNIGGPLMTPNEGREISGLPPIEGGDELLKPMNMTPPAAAPATDPADESATDQQRAAFDAQCRAALADVAARMLKRLSTQSERTKSEAWAEFIDTLEAKHGETIRAAFAPLVPLCRGDAAHLNAVADRVFKTARASAPGIPIQTPADTLAGEILSIIRNRT